MGQPPFMKQHPAHSQMGSLILAQRGEICQSRYPDERGNSIKISHSFESPRHLLFANASRLSAWSCGGSRLRLGRCWASATGAQHRVPLAHTRPPLTRGHGGHILYTQARLRHTHLINDILPYLRVHIQAMPCTPDDMLPL